MVGSATLVMVMSSTSIRPVSASTARARFLDRWPATAAGRRAGGCGLDVEASEVMADPSNYVTLSPICVTIAHK
jgi:hypothetical protein